MELTKELDSAYFIFKVGEKPIKDIFTVEGIISLIQIKFKDKYKHESGSKIKIVIGDYVFTNEIIHNSFSEYETRKEINIRVNLHFKKESVFEFEQDEHNINEVILYLSQLKTDEK